MTEYELRARTKKFALLVMKLVEELPKTTVGRAIGSQLVRSGTYLDLISLLFCEIKSLLNKSGLGV